jgi:hypothetical protein
MWADKLIALGQGLVDRKNGISFALSIHTAVGVDAARMAIESLDLKITRLVTIVERKTEREGGVEEMMEELGGREDVINDPFKLDSVANRIVDDKKRQDEADEQKVKEGLGKFSGMIAETENRAMQDRRKAAPDIPIVNTAIRRALNSSLDTILEENARLYSLKLKEQTKQIQDALDASTHLILRSFDAGPYERILDPVSSV